MWRFAEMTRGKAFGGSTDVAFPDRNDKKGLMYTMAPLGVSIYYSWYSPSCVLVVPPGKSHVEINAKP